MRPSEIDKQRRQRPFVPFRLRMTDGTGYEVRHPEMLVVSRTVVAAALYKARSREPEGIILCEPVHVIRIEPLTEGRQKGSSPGRK